MTELKIKIVGEGAGIVLPQEVLERLHLQAGDSLYLIETEQGIELRTNQESPLTEQLGVAERVMPEGENVLRRLAE